MGLRGNRNDVQQLNRTMLARQKQEAGKPQKGPSLLFLHFQLILRLLLICKSKAGAVKAYKRLLCDVNIFYVYLAQMYQLKQRNAISACI